MKITLYFFLFSIVTMGQNDLEKSAKLLTDKHYVKAEQELESYVAAHPNDIKGIELLGDAYGHQKKWDNAIANYKKLVMLSPNTANFHYKYGGALGMKALSVSKIQALGIIGDVKEAFTTAATLDPKHIETRWALVELYMQLPGIIGGSKSKSLNYAEQLQNLSKVDGYLAKGYIYQYDKDYKSAENFYKLAVKEGGSLICYEKLAALYQLQKQPEQVIATLVAAQKAHHNNALNYDIGKVTADYKTQLDTGEQHLLMYINQYTAKDSISKAWANYRLAQIYKLQNDKSKALTYIDLAIVDSPKVHAFQKEKTAILKL